jgi:replicative DNA helicase
MPPRTLVRRMLCQAAGLGQAALASGAMPTEHRRKLAAGRERLAALRNRIEFTSAPIGFEELERSADSVPVVFVDYLQLVRHPQAAVRGHERIEDTVAKLVECAQRTGAVFVMAAAQGREGGDKRDIRNATRGSSSIEYSADAVYCAEEPTPENRRSPAGFDVEFACLKQREGERRRLVVPIDGGTGLITEEVRR